jgi:hypothetical protein
MAGKYSSIKRAVAGFGGFCRVSYLRYADKRFCRVVRKYVAALFKKVYRI